MATDPICGMEVDEKTAPSLQVGDTTYYFCCDGCRSKFAAQAESTTATSPGEPSREAASCCSAPRPMISLNVLPSTPPPQPSAAKARYFCPCCPGEESDQPGDCGKCGMPLQANPAYRASANEYTCPMHPEVRQDGPGSCPICGMDLEPVGPVAGDDMGLRDMTRRLWLAVAMTVPLLVISMGPMIGLPLDRWLPPHVNAWLQCLLCTPVVFWVAWPIWQRAWQSLVNRSPNMFTLIAIGTATAYVFSLVVLIAPGILPDWLGAAEHVIYFEAASVIVTLVILGQVLEIRARSQVQSAVSELMSLAPDTAIRLEDGQERTIATSGVRVGDRLKIYPGQKVPVDGEVVSGTSYVDESMISGESTPVQRQPGDAIVGGTLNQSGALEMKAKQVGADTLLAKIVDMVAHAQRSRAPIQQLADRVAGWFVPAVLTIALVTFVVWLFVAPAEQRLASAILASVSVLLVACPCALGLATPISIMVGVGRAAQHGILLKNGESVQSLALVDTLTLDKTGTLTVGRPEVSQVRVVAELDEDEFLETVAAIESSSEHPLAKAVVRAAEARQLSLQATDEFRVIAGQGVKARVAGKTWWLGNHRLLQEQGIEVPAAVRDDIQATQASTILAARDQQFIGWLEITDQLKPTSAEAVRQLMELGIEPIMLTGDRAAVAEHIAKQVGLERVVAEVDPEGKQRSIKELQAAGRRVAMAGDGINDAPSLAAADVGIAMGTGTDVAIETADVSLVSGDLLQLVSAIKISRKVLKNIKQNLWFAFGYNAAGIPIAAGVLYPWLGIMLSPMLAAALMSLSSVSVIGNALRLRAVKL